MKYMQLFHQIKPLFKMKKHFIRTMLQSLIYLILNDHVDLMNEIYT